MVMFNVGDIVTPKDEWLNEGEVKEPFVVVEAHEDKALNKCKCVVAKISQLEKWLHRTTPTLITPWEHTFGEYFDLVEKNGYHNLPY